MRREDWDTSYKDSHLEVQRATLEEKAVIKGEGFEVTAWADNRGHLQTEVKTNFNDPATAGARLEAEKKNNAEASSAASTLAKSRKVKLTGKKAAK